jgi:hypothetical protein
VGTVNGMGPRTYSGGYAQMRAILAGRDPHYTVSLRQHREAPRDDCYHPTRTSWFPFG